jgi:hypothetical protein
MAIPRPIQQWWAGYAPSGEHPLASYALLVAVFSSLFAGFLAALGIRRQRLPERIALGDLALIAVATYRLARLLSKDSVTSFLRAPFTEFVKPIGEGEVEERPRGTGLRHAIGEMLGCPFCLAQWVAAGFIYGLVLAPRLTRVVASIFAVYAAADWLQLANDAAKSGVQAQEDRER